MTVKELITRLLDENMDADVIVATTDESKKTATSADRNNVGFVIEDIESSGDTVFLGFQDWRDVCKNN